MKVSPAVVALPNFDDCVPNRFACGTEDSSAHVGNLAHARSQRVVDDDQIVVGIERQMIWVERAFGLTWRENQLLRERTWHGEKCCSKPDTLEELAATAHGNLGNAHDKEMLNLAAK